jgi:hypothetical protein
MLDEINKNYISGAPRIFENLTVRLLHNDKESVPYKIHISHIIQLLHMLYDANSKKI